MNTRQKILDRALEMFNERGIEYVGLRELATDLDIRVSNITYYFPTKDDLVFQLSQELARKNSAIIVDTDHLTMAEFLAMLRQVFEHHYEFRGLLRSFVHIMTQNKLVLASYKKTQKDRKSTIASNIQTLSASGYLKVEGKDELAFLVSNIVLISRYWISEAAVFASELSKEEQINHYLSLITTMFVPYTSAKARKEIEAFQQQLA